MACPKCGYHAMRLLNGKWQCKSSICDYREGGVKDGFVKGASPYVFMKDPAVTVRELHRVHGMSGAEVARASGRGR